MTHNIKWKEGEEVTLADGLGAKSNKESIPTCPLGDGRSADLRKLRWLKLPPRPAITALEQLRLRSCYCTSLANSLIFQAVTMPTNLLGAQSPHEPS